VTAKPPTLGFPEIVESDAEPFEVKSAAPGPRGSLPPSA
jgi:hypothetical protein